MILVIADTSAAVLRSRQLQTGALPLHFSHVGRLLCSGLPILLEAWWCCCRPLLLSAYYPAAAARALLVGSSATLAALVKGVLRQLKGRRMW
jgi:hypothetical protein